jgi:hypothetical protein
MKAKPRGGGHGLDADLARRAAEKYDVSAEREAQQWIETLSRRRFSSSFAASLKDGQALCLLINAIKPGTIARIETSNMPFKQMENISNFLRGCRSLGVLEYELFETVDLYEEKDIGLVVRCIHSLGRTVQTTVPSFRGPHLGVKGGAVGNVADEKTASAGRVATLETGMTKLSMGSAAVMQRTEVRGVMDPLFGARQAGDPVSNDVSRMNMGSYGVMDRSAVDVSKSVTFGADAGTGSVGAPPPRPTPPAASRPAPPPSRPAPPSTAAPKHPPAPGYPEPQAVREPVGGRGGGFGLDAELERQKQLRYDHGAEAEAREWITAVTGERPRAGQGFSEWLRDGTVLCKLANGIVPNTIRTINQSTMPFKQMENISSYLRACRTFGMSEYDLFETVDLYEDKDIGLVVRQILALGRTIQTTVPRYRGPVVGPRMAQSNPRDFNEEQLRRARADASMTKISQGSYGVMDRSEVSVSNDITFGSKMAGGTGATDVPTKWSEGSSRVMERAEVSRSNDITFGHQMGTKR